MRRIVHTTYHLMVRNLVRLLPYAYRHWLKLVAILALTIAGSVTTVLQPWPMKILVDYALGDVAVPEWLQRTLSTSMLEPTATTLVVLAGVLSVGIFFANSALDFLLSWLWMATGQRMVYELAEAIYDRLLRLSLVFHSRRSVGDHLERLTTDTWCVYTLVSESLVSPLQRLVTLFSVGAVAWTLSPFMTLLTFAVAPFLAGSVVYFGPRLKKRARRGRDAHSQLTRFVHQTVTAMPLVQAFGTAERNQAQFEELVDNVVAASQQGVIVDKSFALVNGLTNSAGRAVLVFTGAIQVLAGNMTVGSLLVFLAYLRTLQGAAENLLQTYSKVKTAEANLDRLYEVLDAKETVEEMPQACELPASSAGGAHVRFDHVTFGYEPGRPVLRNVSFEALPGQTLAIVGPTGAGKSSLVSLIPRFFDPWDGEVLLNGVDVREATLDSLRSQIAIVMQEPFLLPLSVTENIRYGAPSASQEAVIAAARAANAHDFIEQLPSGYDTIIGERGSTLSGGQKQRLSIARALVRNAPLVILDEPTSALDAETEAKLLEALERLAEGRTTFVIAHRLSTIRDADRILVLDDGRVIECGTHQQLLADGQLYRKLHVAQFGAAQEVGV